MMSNRRRRTRAPPSREPCAKHVLIGRVLLL
jgi:hypothetical protein